MELEDDDINNVILNLWQPQDIWHPIILACAERAEIAVNDAAVPPMTIQALVTQKDRFDAWTKKHPPLLCSALSVKKMKLVADIACYYTGIRQSLTKENMEYVIIKDYNDHLKLVKCLRKDQDVKLMKCWRDTVALWWFEAALTFMNACYMYLPLYYHVDVFILRARRPKHKLFFLQQVFWLTCK